MIGLSIFMTSKNKKAHHQLVINRRCALAAVGEELAEKVRLSSLPKERLCDLISSYTARRTFDTNFYLQGFPTIDLIKITSHKTELAFLTYIRISKLDKAKRLNKHIKQKWNNSLRRVAKMNYLQ